MTLPDGSVKGTLEPEKASPPILPRNPEKEIRPIKLSTGLYPPLPDDDDNWSEPPRGDISLEKEKPPPSYNVAEDLGCDLRSYWREIHKKAASEGVVVPHAYPVIVRANDPNEWNPLSWDLIKEVRKSVHNYGLMAPFTKALLDNIFGAQLLTPYDCDQLASMLLKPTQKMLWRDRWRGLCEEVAIKNLDRPDDDPMKAIGMDHLIGTGKFTDPRLQARFPIEALRTASVMAFKAMMTLPEEGRNVTSFMQIKQGPQELYTSFVDRLRDAVTKQVSSVEAQNALALKLAVENANADCKKLLMALPRDASLVDMVEACNKVGTTSFQMTALAEVFVVALRGDKKCYNCGKPGHLKAQCRAKGKLRQNHSQYR
uniref:CCHC-type domain-containing protein n=1 Tax=Buteo japonicus TaxID=224669 RepID=A0A8C0AT76_9AVES